MTTQFQPPFTNLQQELLRVFSMNLADEDLLAIRRLIARYLLEKIRNRMDDKMESEWALSDEELTWMSMQLSEPSLAEVWENEEDEIWNRV